jgi:hypothetical protein
MSFFEQIPSFFILVQHEMGERKGTEVVCGFFMGLKASGREELFVTDLKKLHTVNVQLR